MLQVLALAFLSVQPTDLVFVRHGETIANATGKYNSRTIDAFSTKGKAEVEALTKKLLAEPRFDRILVSPSPRALYTIAPYLRATRQKAMVWPLLYECCTQRRPENAVSTAFRWGGKIRLPNDISDLFTIDPGNDRYPISPDYDAGLAQVEACLTEFHSRLSGQRVLLVGHSGQGGQFLHGLTGKWTKLENGQEVRVKL